MAPTRHCGHALFGNVVLSRLPILHHAQYDLSWKTCEPRCCQRVDIAVGDDTLHLYNVHLGTAFLERRYQAGRLSAIVHDRRVGPAEDRPRRLQRVDAGARDADAEPAAARASTCGRTCGGAGRIPASFPCCTWITSTTRERSRCEGGTAANAARADGVGSSAARGRAEGRIQLSLAFFFVLFFFDRQETCRRTKGFAEIVDGKIAHVKRHHAVCALLFDHDGHRAALDAFAERQIGIRRRVGRA